MKQKIIKLEQIKNKVNKEWPQNGTKIIIKWKFFG